MLNSALRRFQGVARARGSVARGHGQVIGRWYVTLFGIVFVWCAVRDLGWRRTVVYTFVALAVGGLAENGSVHLGVPCTRYSFNSDLRGDELFLGDVSLMAPLSYTFMAYFAFSAGRMLASGPWRTRASHPWHEWLLALILAVWALWILDPVSRRAPLLSRRAVPVRGAGVLVRVAARQPARLRRDRRHPARDALHVGPGRAAAAG
jgi:uncharacterized membrane protein